MTYWDEIDKKKYCAWCGNTTPKSIEKNDLFRDFKYGNFDKQRCAENFANAAYRIGIRKLRREDR
jgi:hypothetical protein